MDKIVKESKIDLYLLGKVVNVENIGEGIVIGYSPVTGEPFAYFYDAPGDRVICFSHKSIIGGTGSRVRKCENGTVTIY